MGSYNYSEILSGLPRAQTLPAHPRGCCNNTGLHKRIPSKKKVSQGTAYWKSYFRNNSCSVRKINTMANIPNTLPFACLVLSALFFSFLPRSLSGLCWMQTIYCDDYTGSNVSAAWIFQYFDVSLGCIVLTSVCRLTDCCDWRGLSCNYREMLILCFKDAWGAEGCDPPEIRPCVACQAQVPEHSALRVEHSALIQSSATAEKDRRTGEGKQSASGLY